MRDKNILPKESKEVYVDTLSRKKPQPRDSVKLITKKNSPKKKKKTIKQTPVDTVAVSVELPDTNREEEIENPCVHDTLAPWVYPDPSGGLHYGKIFIQFQATEPCSILWRFKNDDVWNTYTHNEDSIEIAENITLCFSAKDSCGNTMVTRYEHYEISTPHKRTYCPENMEYISSNGKKFCIDRYEWPNKRGRKPLSNISFYQAMDSCFKVNKRLCTTEEWSKACRGIYNWKYTYGSEYEPYACVTRDTTVQKSGNRVECRGYFELFDMSGNLAEWTNTKSTINNSFYNVMGGFWESGPQSTCFDPRYSYFPTNTHNPVGFRCCKEANKNNE